MNDPPLDMNDLLWRSANIYTAQYSTVDASRPHPYSQVLSMDETAVNTLTTRHEVIPCSNVAFDVTSFLIALTFVAPLL